MPRILPLLLVALFLPACTQCERACREEAGVFEACLDDWDLEWRDLGAEDRDDFQAECIAGWNRRLEATEDSSEETSRCRGLADDLFAAGTDCDAAWQALIGY